MQFFAAFSACLLLRMLYSYMRVDWNWRMACVGRPSVTIQRPRAGAAQWRPMKAAWFDALIFDTHFGGQNCLSVAQALQAQLGNLMAMRQSLRIQIDVCWLQCLIELAGAGVVDIQTWFLVSFAALWVRGASEVRCFVAVLFCLFCRVPRCKAAQRCCAATCSSEAAPSGLAWEVLGEF